MILQEEKEEQAYTKSEDTGKLAFFCAALVVSLTQHTHPTLTSAFTRLAQQDEATVMGGLDLQLSSPQFQCSRGSASTAPRARAKRARLNGKGNINTNVKIKININVKIKIHELSAVYYFIKRSKHVTFPSPLSSLTPLSSRL